MTASSCPPFTSCLTKVSRTLRIPAGGRWSRDLSAQVDLVGHDKVRGEWTGARGTATLEAIVPWMDVRVDASRLAGAGLPLSTVVATVRDAGVKVGAMTARTRLTGEFGGTVRSGGGVRLVHPGDVVRASFATDAEITATASIVVLGGPTDSLVGTCPALAPYRLSLVSSTGNSSFVRTGTTSAGGEWAETAMNLPTLHGWSATQECVLPTGDRVSAQRTLP